MYYQGDKKCPIYLQITWEQNPSEVFKTHKFARKCSGTILSTRDSKGTLV